MRNRNMYFATGQPGWMRFGYSPGWIDRNADWIGPCVDKSIAGPHRSQQWQRTRSEDIDNLEILKNSAVLLEKQLNAIKQRIDEIENK